MARARWVYCKAPARSPWAFRIWPMLLPRVATVGWSVTYVLAQDALGFAFVAFGGGDCGQVQSRDLLVGGGKCGELGGGACLPEVAVLDGGGGDHVGDVD